jgi:predicted phage tail protein
LIDAANAAVVVDVTDGAGDTGSGSSGLFAIDSTAPTVASTNPASGAQNVATNSAIVITFSEAMDRALTEGATTISPAVTVTGRAWSAGDTVLTTTTSGLAAGTLYTVTVSTAARDACNPGIALATQRQFSFRTAALLPNPPSGVTATAQTPTTVRLTWTAPTTYTDNSALAAADIQGYYIERAKSTTGARTNVTSAGPVTTTSFTDTGLAPGATYYYWVKTLLDDGRVSADSTPASVTMSAQAQDLTWLWILLIIIIVVILIIALLAMRRRKKPAAAPPATSTSTYEAPPAEESPAEGGEGGTEESAGGAQ